ncbi:lipase 1-like [Arctopsyche grandis]|uniref:lipase 1-like n=1 Tax=Arctopsyche grandis TaxID=121162 RepID=UPI00406D8F13
MKMFTLPKVFYWLMTTLMSLAVAQRMKSKIPIEAFMKLPELADNHGYSVRKYQSETPDGYKITTFRINNMLDRKKLPVLLIHGLTGSAEDFVRMGPKRSLAFLMADAGYDVWLGNVRGNTYSSHASLKRSDIEFWNYSYEEHGKYDIPSVMETILRETFSSKLHVIAVSLGTTVYFVACHRRPDLAAKVATFTALGPVVSPGKAIRRIPKWIFDLHLPNRLKNVNLDPFSFPNVRILSELCKSDDPTTDRCYTKIYFPICGEDYEQVDWNKTTIIIGRLQPISMKTIEHLSQMAYAGAFQEYDFGRRLNMEKYGYSSPKLYNLSANVAPTILIFGKNDQMAEARAGERLARELRKTNPKVMTKLLPYEKFNHIDFVYAKNIHTLLNYDILKIFETIYEK